MADVKISGLPAASSVASGDTVPIVQGGVTKKATPDQFPVSVLQAAADALRVAKAGDTMTGPLVLSGDATLPLHAVTLQQLQAALLGFGKRTRVRVGTTANINTATALVTGQVLNGVTLAAGDLVLVKDQTTASQNGVYVVGATPVRSPEYDTWAEFPGSLVAVYEGTTNADTLWLCTNNDGGTLNTTAIVFTQFSAAGALLTANALSELSGVAATARGNIGAAYIGALPEVVSGTTYTFVAADKGKHKVFANAAGCSATVPTGLGTDFQCSFAKDAAAGTLTMVAASGVTLLNESGSLTMNAANGSGALISTTTADTFTMPGSFGSAASGDVTGPSSSVDGELVLFNATTGKIIKRANISGLVKATSGVASAAVAGTDYYAPGSTDVAVADGGTGVSSLTAYAPLFGGTTGTGPVQSGTVGTSGQVLTSNGPGALPTFQTATGGSTSVTVEDVTGTTYTVVAGDQGKCKRFTNAAGCTVSINTGLGAGFNFIWERSSAAGLVTFGGTATLAAANGSASLVANGRSGAVMPEATDVYTISGILGGKVLAASGKTLTSNNTLTLQGTDASTVDVGAGGTVAFKDKQTAVTKNWSATPVALTDGATINTDASLGNTFKLTIAGTGRTLANPTNLVDGMQLTWRIKQDATGARTITTYGSLFSWGSAGAPTLSTAANKVDYITGYYDATDNKIHAIFNGGF